MKQRNKTSNQTVSPSKTGIARTLDASMTRREFLQMSGALILSLIGIQNLLSVLMRHTNTTPTSPTSLLTKGDTTGFGTRGFGQ